MGLFGWLLKLLGGSESGAYQRDDGSNRFQQSVRTPQRDTTRDGAAPYQVDGHAPARPSPRVKTLNLDAAQFAPLSDEEVRRRARGISFWSSPWFGRRDRIPPAGDPRTKLIDQAMVAHGYLTPQDLVEIHAAGEAMDQVRPDLAIAAQQAAQQAQEAVKRSKEERAALKRQKKAEAAERKRRHAEAVAQRKATDIVFLGRGVSGGLANRQSNAEKLQSAGLPVLGSPADVAAALGLPIPRLRWLAFHAETAMASHYVRFTVPKKNGGPRELAAPHRSLAACQEWILRNILEKLAPHPAAHGFVRARSTVTNAAPHAGRTVLVNADLKDFFPTVTYPRVRGLFEALGYSPSAATILALLCTECPRRTVEYAGVVYHVAKGPRALPQGACTSPALSNLAARRLDARLDGIARKLGWTYTRYADDLSFSASGEAAGKTGYLLARIRHIAQDEGFTANEAKTRVQRRNQAQTVTGIVVNDRPGVPRTMVRRLRAILHRAKKEGLAAQNRQNHPRFEAWLRGMVAYVAMVQPSQGAPLRAALDGLDAAAKGS